jgi:hypothetical protein
MKTPVTRAKQLKKNTADATILAVGWLKPHFGTQR